MQNNIQYNQQIVDLINSVDDKDCREELIAIHKNYKQVIAGLRIALTYLEQIDQETGCDHSEMSQEVVNLIKQAKYCQIDLLEMSAAL